MNELRESTGPMPKSLPTEKLPYAPPEYFARLETGATYALKSWDWWSVGRVIQECVLGRHVMSVVFGLDILTSGDRLTDRVESLMLGLESESLRPGGELKS